MGISGLLPALRSIQVTKHLSEFSGQVLAVDAYVWLHKGVYACATEIATGKPTNKYVDYAMHRVRLLRHHRIEPYVVFDGGPLPAKKGTEGDRKKKRDENLARGNALAALGKHHQAREFYVKCVDVTPEMAYQFIKALKAENVPYVVAPYEADAQLAYLERIGLVDGIITEDSDLLVFGCKQVLFKLDVVANTIVSIARKDFGSITSSSSDSNGISLLGWSDVQFRAMAILSGCDYLPSVPGVGLKTACSMLRKWKTVEQVVRVLTLEGKKPVPSGYLKQFKLAEKCFLHQRVYCPTQEQMVHLTDVDAEWTEEDDVHVGRKLEASLAQSIARGDTDPVNHLPMQDINPSYQPRAHKSLPIRLKQSNQRDKGKGKAVTPIKEGILTFFGPNAKIPFSRRSLSPSAMRKRMVVGKSSGKRTLADVMDMEMAAKHQASHTTIAQSKFFAPKRSAPRRSTTPKPAPSRRTSIEDYLRVPGPSGLQSNKENVWIVIDDDEDDASNISVQVQVDPEAAVDQDIEEPVDEVEQEVGYLSPTASQCGDAPEFSSPVWEKRTPKRRRSDLGQADSDLEPISSPSSGAKQARCPSDPQTLRVHAPTPLDLGTNKAKTLVKDTSRPKAGGSSNLRDVFSDEPTSDIEEDQISITRGIVSPLSPSPPSAPPHAIGEGDEVDLDCEILDLGTQRSFPESQLHEADVESWGNKWRWSQRGIRESELVRRETNVTPKGKHALDHHVRGFSSRHPMKRTAQTATVVFRPKRPPIRQQANPVQTRILQIHSIRKPVREAEDLTEDGISEGVRSVVQSRLSQFRCS